jgi:hypothetical protein
MTNHDPWEGRGDPNKPMVKKKIQLLLKRTIRKWLVWQLGDLEIVRA